MFCQEGGEFCSGEEEWHVMSLLTRQKAEMCETKTKTKDKEKTKDNVKDKGKEKE